MGFLVPGRKPPINNSSFNRSLYSSRIFSITGEKPQHQKHMGSATYSRVFSFIRTSSILHFKAVVSHFREDERMSGLLRIIESSRSSFRCSPYSPVDMP